MLKLFYTNSGQFVCLFVRCTLTEPSPGCRRQHTADSPAALAPWLIDLTGQGKRKSQQIDDTHSSQWRGVTFAVYSNNNIKITAH